MFLILFGIGLTGNILLVVVVVLFGGIFFSVGYGINKLHNKLMAKKGSREKYAASTKSGKA